MDQELGSNSLFGTLTQPYKSIQYCLSKVNEGDTIIVEKGEYDDIVTWPNKSDIVLISASGPDSTIIDISIVEEFPSGWSYPNWENSVIYFPVNIGNATLSGFSIKGGGGRAISHWGGKYGGGICIDSDNIINIDNCIITENGYLHETKGAAIGVANNSNLIIKNSVIINNKGNSEGSAIHFWSNNDILNKIESSLIADNEFPNVNGSVASVYNINSDVEFVSCTISNIEQYTNGFIHSVGSGSPSTTIKNSIINANIPISDNEIFISFSNIVNNDFPQQLRKWKLSENPMFDTLIGLVIHYYIIHHVLIMATQI